MLLTSTFWRNDRNGFSHQGPGLIDTMIPLSPSVVRVWLPPDADCTLSISEHCFASRDHVNLIVVDKQSHLQYLMLEQAREHCAAGAGIWEWAGTATDGREPDVVLACAGDVPTLETLAAAQLLREQVPQLEVRVVNIVDLMALLQPDEHPRGFSEDRFAELFGTDLDVVMAFHGYPRAVHQLLHGRPHPERFHVRGFDEQGTTATPFDHGRAQRDEPLPPRRPGFASGASDPGGRRTGDRALRADARPSPGLRRRAPGGHAGGARLAGRRADGGAASRTRPRP